MSSCPRIILEVGYSYVYLCTEDYSTNRKRDLRMPTYRTVVSYFLCKYLLVSYNSGKLSPTSKTWHLQTHLDRHHCLPSRRQLQHYHHRDAS